MDARTLEVAPPDAVSTWLRSAFAVLLMGLFPWGCMRAGFGVQASGDAATSIPDMDVVTGDGAKDAVVPSLKGCGEPPDPFTVARFTMEDQDTMLTDATGSHDGSWQRTAPLRINGPSNCGGAVQIQAGAYGLVANSPAWDLEVGSIDFWTKVPEIPAGEMGILSRDANKTDLPGHFSVYYSTRGEIAVRLQSATDSTVVCTNAPLPQGKWLHIGINFGSPGLEVWVNGTLNDGPGTTRIGLNTFTCGGTTTLGIAGNDNPWIIGGANPFSPEGQGPPVDFLFNGGSLDEIRISNIRRDFSRIEL